MAGITKQPGPTAKRVAANIRRFRRSDETDITTDALSERLAAVGQPIPATAITKTEKGTRRVDVDDLMAFALALGVTPTTLLLPRADYLSHYLTPATGGRAEKLWQWAQGEEPLHLDIPGSDAWLPGEYPDLRFSTRSRPYLTTLHAPDAGPGWPRPGLRDLAQAVADAIASGVTPAQVRRVVELAIVLPSTMTRPEKPEAD